MEEADRIDEMKRAARWVNEGATTLDRAIRQASVEFYGAGDARAYQNETGALLRIGAAVGLALLERWVEEQGEALGEVEIPAFSK